MKDKMFLRSIWNRILHSLARHLPGATSLRPFFHKMRGVKIKGKVFIGDEVYLENEYPENIEIQDGAVISMRCILISHFRGRGKIVIEKNAFIGPNTVILPNVTIGEGAVIAALSVVNKSITPYTFAGGTPSARPIAKVGSGLGLGKNYADFIKTLRPIKNKSIKLRG